MKTIKVTMLGVMSLFVINNAKAQVEMKFGVKAGLNYSIVSSAIENGESANGFGYHAGAIMDLGFSEMLNFRVELLGSNRTVKSKESIDFLVKIKTEWSSSPLYLALPIMYKYNISDNFALMGGPQLSFLMSNTSKTSVTTGDQDPVEVKTTGSDAKEGMRSMELGFALGAEYGVSENIFIGLRYVRGLQSVSDINNIDSKDFANVIQLGATYKF